MVQARVARLEATGEPEVIGWHDAEVGDPAPGEVRVRTTAVGLNFIDTYHRRGLYPVPLPSGLGVEGVGVIEAAGAGSGFVAGDRVATFGPALGAYATHRLLPAAQLLRVPDDVSDETAAAVLLKGCTVEFLVERCARVAPDQTVLVHAAAGGVGLLLVQWLRQAGATVIGTVSTAAKAAAAQTAGAAHVIRYDEEPVAPAVRALTGGRGVHVVFDGVGRDTWEASLGALARRGLLVSYGNASGVVGAVDFGLLARHGSLFTTRPTLFDYYAEPAERAAGAERLWAMLRGGALQVTIGARYPLEQAAQAHRDLEARATSGSVVLVP